MLKYSAVALLTLAAACASSKAATKPSQPKPAVVAAPVQPDASRAPGAASSGPQPIVEPAVAYMLGLMPLRSAGVDQFRAAHPTYRGQYLDQPKARLIQLQGDTELVLGTATRARWHWVS